MAATFASRRIRHERMMDRRLTTAHRDVAREIAVWVRRMASARNDAGEAIVPNTQAARTQLREQIWAQVLKPFYIGPGVDPLADAAPRSPYARLLRAGVEGAVRLAAEQQASLVNRMVRDEVVVQWLTGPRAALPVTEQRRRAYDPWHQWVDPNGYRLSDRIWQAGITTRSRLDAMLTYHIQQGTGAEQMAALLEDFLTPGARLMRTRTPYGSEGAYAARRLARTEITAAAGRALVDSSQMNPFVAGIQWQLSRAHRCCDICDDNARGGENGDGVYPVGHTPDYPAHPHCMCTLTPVPLGTTADLVEQLRRDIALQRPDAQRLRGILNPAFLTNAILFGLLAGAMEGVLA